MASGAHLRTTVLELVAGEHFPADVVRDMRRYRSRGGSVKANWVLSEPPRYDVTLSTVGVPDLAR